MAFISTKRRVLLFITHDATRKKPRGIHRFITATPWLSHACFFFSHEYVVQGVTSQALDVGNKWPLSCYHLQTSPLLLSMSYEYFTTIPQQYTDPLEPVYSSIYWREHGAEIQKRAQFTGSRTLFTSNANINFFLNSFEWSGFEGCTNELKNFSQKMLILICKHLSCIYILSHFFFIFSLLGTWVTKFFLYNRLRNKNMFY